MSLKKYDRINIMNTVTYPENSYILHVSINTRTDLLPHGILDNLTVPTLGPVVCC